MIRKKTLRMVSLVVTLAMMISIVSTASVYAENPQNLYSRDASAKNGVVAAAKPEAAQVGIDVLKKGGNAVDAAVATAFALGVLEPNASGMGGGGFMIVRMAKSKKSIVIDFRETAPGKTSPTYYTVDKDGIAMNHESVYGGKAVGVPGEVAGLMLALEKYGTMKRAKVMQPAIDLAENGFTVTNNLSSIITDSMEVLSTYPEAAKTYLKEGLPYEVGDKLVLKDYAKTLRLVAEKGRDGFYKGEMAEKIAAEIQKQGGCMTVEDLNNYKAIERTPVTGTYRGYSIISTPPASSGGTHVIQMLNILENFDVQKMGDNTPDSFHLWAETMKLMFADRAKYMADTAFVKVPLKGLTSKDYAKVLANKIDMTKAATSVKADDAWKYESGSTTSLAVMDKQGNMVAMTKSINYFFGSGVVIPGTGVMMNNHMDDFVASPGSANSVEPGKRPLSSMSPTLVLDPKGRPFMTIGSPGATRIMTTVAQVISNVIDHKMDIQKAILAPRIWCNATSTLRVEGRISLKSYEELKARGHKIDIYNDYDPYFGGVHAVEMDYATKTLHGGADPRRDGKALGFKSQDIGKD